MYEQQPSCRLCLSEEGVMEPIFESTDRELPQKIYECTSIQVVEHAEFPAFLCEICKSELIIWMKFRRQCLRANETLKAKFPELFKGPEVEKDSNNENSESGDEEEMEEEILEQDICRQSQSGIAEEEGGYDDEEIQETANTTEIETQLLTDDEETSSPKLAESNKERNTKRIRRTGDVRKIVLPNNRVRYLTKCKICGKDQQNIKQHMRIHLDEKPFTCSYCSKSFRQRGNFTRHLNIHEGIKPYKCAECEASFTDPASLRAHKVRHTGAREYPCDICGKAFGHSHVLAAHKRIHTQDRRFSCGFCEKRFLSNHALKKHVRTHTGEKPYKCKVCSKSFATSGNLTTHQRVHTKVRPYVCNFCNMNFSYRCVLKTHLKVHAKKLNEDDEGGEMEIFKIQEYAENAESESDEEVYEVYMDVPDKEA